MQWNLWVAKWKGNFFSKITHFTNCSSNKRSFSVTSSASANIYYMNATEKLTVENGKKNENSLGLWCMQNGEFKCTSKCCFHRKIGKKEKRRFGTQSRWDKSHFEKAKRKLFFVRHNANAKRTTESEATFYFIL